MGTQKEGVFIVFIATVGVGSGDCLMSCLFIAWLQFPCFKCWRLGA